ncbi:MAG: PAS domain-containing sensor histidine kinase, partial [Desulfuromonadales bacterium]|nr:PAS domain-containing sensor histidine kinase [Desulfuromonadales bacterium]
REQQINLEINIAAKPLLVNVDPGQIQQVLLNLTMNGIQAMPEGGSLILSCHHVAEIELPDSIAAIDTSWICLQVRDQGVGIEAEMLGQIFDPFFTTKDIGQGTGLGLSIAYGIIEEHGGWIDVSSTLGVGSCFSVYLPENQLENQPDEA